MCVCLQTYLPFPEFSDHHPEKSLCRFPSDSFIFLFLLFEYISFFFFFLWLAQRLLFGYLLTIFCTFWFNITLLLRISDPKNVAQSRKQNTTILSLFVYIFIFSVFVSFRTIRSPLPILHVLFVGEAGQTGHCTIVHLNELNEN